MSLLQKLLRRVLLPRKGSGHAWVDQYWHLLEDRGTAIWGHFSGGKCWTVVVLPDLNEQSSSLVSLHWSVCPAGGRTRLQWVDLGARWPEAPPLSHLWPEGIRERVVKRVCEEEEPRGFEATDWNVLHHWASKNMIQCWTVFFLWQQKGPAVCSVGLLVGRERSADDRQEVHEADPVSIPSRQSCQWMQMERWWAAAAADWLTCSTQGLQIRLHAAKNV